MSLPAPLTVGPAAARAPDAPVPAAATRAGGAAAVPEGGAGNGRRWRADDAGGGAEDGGAGPGGGALLAGLPDVGSTLGGIRRGAAIVGPPPPTYVCTHDTAPPGTCARARDTDVVRHPRTQTDATSPPQCAAGQLVSTDATHVLIRALSSRGPASRPSALAPPAAAPAAPLPATKRRRV